MTDTLLQVTLSGAILIAGIFLFRRFACGRIPASAFVLLWDIAALRLLIPWSLPQVAGIGTAAASLLQQGAQSTEALEKPGVPAVLVIVWAVGAAVAGAWIAAGYIREARCLSRAVPLPDSQVKRCCRLVPGINRVRLFVSHDITTAVASGVLRRRIVLPSGCTEWSSETLRCVLTHELVHLHKADNLRRIFMLTAAIVHWFNPLVWVAAAASERDVEAACDARSVRLLGQHGRREYAHALVDLAEQQCGLRISASTFSSGAGVRDRVQGVLRRVRWTTGGIAAVIIVGTAAVSSFAAGTTLHADTPMPEDVWFCMDAAYLVDTDTGKVWELQGGLVGYVDAQKALSVELEEKAGANPDGGERTVTFFTADSEPLPDADGA